MHKHRGKCNISLKKKTEKSKVVALNADLKHNAVLVFSKLDL